MDQPKQHMLPFLFFFPASPFQKNVSYSHPFALIYPIYLVGDQQIPENTDSFPHLENFG